MFSKNIVMMENHNDAYYVWRQNCVVDKTLIHIDAHIDFAWIPEIDLNELYNNKIRHPEKIDFLINPFLISKNKMLGIGNFICPAIREGIVKKFYWIVPQDSWQSGRGLKYIVKQIQKILKVNKYGTGNLKIYPDRLCGRILNKEIIVCSLENLEYIDESVLLDIDVDFMLTKFIWDDLNPKRFPWIFPDELFEKLKVKINKVDILTISYSVEGGFSPLKFKYLGDELSFLFKEKVSVEKQKKMSYKRKALFCEKEKKYKEAEALYKEALKVDNKDASIYFNLSLLYLNGGFNEPAKAVDFYKKAVQLDSSYATSYNNYGLLYLRYNKLKKAEVEYKKFLYLEPNNATIYSGLGYISLANKKYDKAKDYFEYSLNIDKKLSGARLGMAIVNLKTKKIDKAEKFLLEFIKDYPYETEAYWWLGIIAQKKGEVSQAINYYKNAVLYCGDGPLVHIILFYLYFISGFYFRAFEELKRLFQILKTLF